MKYFFNYSNANLKVSQISLYKLNVFYDYYGIFKLGNDLFETLAIALNDFNELSSVAALRQIIHVRIEQANSLSIRILISFSKKGY